MVSNSDRTGSAEELPMPTSKRGWKEAGNRWRNFSSYLANLIAFVICTLCKSSSCDCPIHCLPYVQYVYYSPRIVNLIERKATCPSSQKGLKQRIPCRMLAARVSHFVNFLLFFGVFYFVDLKISGPHISPQRLVLSQQLFAHVTIWTNFKYTEILPPIHTDIWWRNWGREQNLY
jgi:hypothetical protein